MSANNIKVAIKVRPILKKEKDKNLNSNWKIVENSIHQIDGASEFYFDHIFDQNINNIEVFDKMAKPIVDSALKGFNGTIFAYGQTASGKTYTMLGDDTNPGVMVLTAREIFKEIEEARDREFLLRVGYIEIYNEKIFDLLSKNDQELKIHEPSNGDVNVNCTEIIITSQKEMMENLLLGTKKRRIGETGMNERSSRSHAIFRIIIESRELNKTRDDGSVQISILNLVDLAGSERADQTGAKGCRFIEGSHINRSLLSLSVVIKQLSEKEDKFINFRDSKLTRILQASLGGNALTTIICTITPTAFEETQSTLNFAMRAKTIKNKPHVNEVLTDSAMMKKLEKEISRLKSALEVEKTKNSQLKVTQLEQQINEQNLKIICSHSAATSKTNPSSQRRRTWAPSHHESNIPIPNQPKINVQHLELESSAPSNLLLNELTRSRIGSYYANNYNKDSHLDINDEFISAENIVFPTSPSHPFNDNLRRTPPNLGAQQSVVHTPKPTIEDRYKKLEEEFESLQAYTNLEKVLQVEHEAFEKIQKQLTDAQAKISKYEREAINEKFLKEKLSETEMNLIAAENGSKQFETQNLQFKEEIELTRTKLNENASQIDVLQKRITELEMENRKYVGLEFQFQGAKNKSKLRERELLDVLKEKDSQLFKLENSLKLLSMKENETNTYNNTNETVRNCIKCADLDKIISENTTLQTSMNVLKVEIDSKQLELAKLIEENKRLLNENETSMQEQLLLKKDFQCLQLERNKLQLEYDVVSKECENLRAECNEVRQTEELANLNETVVNFNAAFEKLKKEKMEAEETAGLEIKNVRSDLAKSQKEILDWQNNHEFTIGEYKKLKFNFDKLQSVIDKTALEKKNLESQYDLLKSNFNRLQEDQNRLISISKGSNKSITNGHTLECDKENYSKLLSKLEILESGNKLLNENKSVIESDKEKLTIELQKVKSELSELKEEQTKLQQEYDNISEEIMDHIQENENLSRQVNMLKDEIDIKNQNSRSSKYNGLNIIQENSDEELINCLKGEIETLKTLNQKLKEEIQSLNDNIEILNTKIHQHETSENDLNNLVFSSTKSLDQKQEYCNLLQNELDALKKTNGHYIDPNTHTIVSNETEPRDTEIETLNIVKTEHNKTEIESNGYDLDMSIEVDNVQENDNHPNYISNKVQVLEYENSQLTETIEKLEIESKNLIEKLKILDLEKDEIKETNLRLTKENSSLLEKLESISEDLNRISEEQLKLYAENNGLKQQTDNLSTQIVCLNESTTSELNSLRDKIDSLLTENEQLKQLNQNLTEQLKKMSSPTELEETSKLTCPDEDHSEKHLSNDNMSEKFDGNEQENSLLKRLNNLDEENIKLKAHNDQLTKKLDSFVEEVENSAHLNNITKELQSKLNNKSTELDKLKEKSELLEQKISKDLIEIAELKIFEETSKNEIVQLKDNIEELIVKCKRLESQCNVQLNEYNDLLAKCEWEETKNIELQKTIQNNGDNMAIISQAEEECKELKTSISTLKSEVEKLEILKNDREKLLQENEALKTKAKIIVTLEHERIQLLEQIRELELKISEYQSNTKTISNLQKEREQLIKENHSLQLNVQKLIENVDQVKKENYIVNEDLRIKVNQIEQMHNKQLNENKTLRIMNTDLGEKTIDLEKERDQLLIENKKLIIDVENILILKNRIQQIADKELEQYIFEKESFNEQLSNLKSSSESTIGILKSENSILEKQNNQLKVELLQIKEEIFKTQVLAEQTTDEVKVMRAKWESELNNLKIRYESKVATQKCLKEQIQNLETEITLLKNKNININNIKINGISPRREAYGENILGESHPSKIKNMTLEDKLEASHKTSQKDRKSRRLSFHDEGRKSLMWDNTQDVQTMTDPTDSSCNCAALDLKVNDLKKKLLIRDSQVNTLCLEMKSNPMKTENERLKKLLQNEDEQQRVLRKEIKTLKQIVLDNRLKCNPSSKRVVCENSTQTYTELMKQLEISEKDIIESNVYKELLGKHEFLKTICRGRHARLQELEQQLNCLENDKQNKSEDSTSNLEEKYNKLLRQFKIISGKYAEAKIICLARAEKIDELTASLKSKTPLS